MFVPDRIILPRREKVYDPDKKKERRRLEVRVRRFDGYVMPRMFGFWHIDAVEDFVTLPI